MSAIRIEPSFSRWPRPSLGQTLWTGHQVSLWHPGILAKYVAVDRVAGEQGGNVIVDQDVYHPLLLDLPTRTGKSLGSITVELAPIRKGWALSSQRPVLEQVILRGLREASKRTTADLSRLVEAVESLEEHHDTLGEQMHALLAKLLSPWAGAWVSRHAVYASSLLQMTGHRALLHRLIEEAPRAIETYNAAVASIPGGAGMSAMQVERERVELPLWWLPWGGPRQRVYADVADSRPMLIRSDGSPIDLAMLDDDMSQRNRLAPRALLMTALLRRGDTSAGFVHGTGGWSYDRVTEHWIEHWLGETLSPRLLATADVHLPFNAPVADRSDLAKALWYRHWLPHNIDRAAGRVEGPLAALVEEKRRVLASMDDDRDRTRRAGLFDRLHAINEALTDAHRPMLDAADADVEHADNGVLNAEVARWREWCFALYPPEVLHSAIKHEVEAHAAPPEVLRGVGPG